MTMTVVEFTDKQVLAEVDEDTGFVEFTPTPTQTARTIESEGYVEFFQTGPQGAPGPAGSTFTHLQTAPSATWTITHNLNTVLSVVILLDSAPHVPVFTDVTYPDLNTAVLEFPSAETGKAYLR